MLGHSRADCVLFAGEEVVTVYGRIENSSRTHTHTLTSTHAHAHSAPVPSRAETSDYFGNRFVG